MLEQVWGTIKKQYLGAIRSLPFKGYLAPGEAALKMADRGLCKTSGLEQFKKVLDNLDLGQCKTGMEQFKKALDNFKRSPISPLLFEVRQEIITKIRSPYFSSKIKTYFESMHAEGVPFTDFAHEPKQITQIKEIINTLYHAEVAFKDLETVDLRSEVLVHQGIDYLYIFFHTISHAYQASYLLTHLDIDLYEIFGKEIDQLITYLARFQDFANSYSKCAEEFRQKIKEFPLGYKAGLVSGIAIDQMKPSSGDIDYNFLTQFSAVLPGYIEQFTNFIQKYSGCNLHLMPQLPKSTEEYKDSYILCQNENEKFLYYIKLNGQLETVSINDFGNFLIKLNEIKKKNKIDDDSTTLRLTDTQLKDLIIPNGGRTQHALQISNLKSPLDPSKVEALEKEAHKLLASLESLRSDDLFLSAKLLYYFDILRRIFFLSKSTFEEIRKCNDSSQEVICGNLAQLKYNWFVKLFVFIDRVEDEYLLAPGTFSKPLMNSLRPWYAFLIEYTSKVVDFSQRGQELLTIEDDRFVRERLEETQQRITKAKKQLLEIEQIEKGLQCFFRTLANPSHATSYLIGLPEDTKKRLLDHYKAIQPYVIKLDLELNNSIINALTNESQWTDNTFYGLLRPLQGEPHEILAIKSLVTRPTTLEQKLKALIAQDKATQNYQRERLEETQQQATEAEKPLLEIEQIEKALQCFFNTLDDPRYTASYLIGLPEDTKKRLLDHYKAIQPYVIELDLELDDNIYKALTEESQWTGNTFFDLLRPWQGEPHEVLAIKSLVTGPTLRVTWPTLEQKLITLIAQDKATQNFHIELNEDIFRSVYKEADLRLFPHPREQNPFSYNEAEVLKLTESERARLNPTTERTNTWFTKLEALTTEQAFTLYQYYEDKKNKLKRAREAHGEFMNISESPRPPLSVYDRVTKAKLRKLYSLFQPYMIGALPPAPGMESYDLKMVASLAKTNDLVSSPQVIDQYFIDTEPTLLARFNDAEKVFTEGSRKYEQQAQKKYKQAQENRKLISDEQSNQRAEFVIKHTQYSQAISEFRKSFAQLLPLLNTHLSKELLAAQTTTELPFPELGDQYNKLAQSQQSIGIKRIFNALYHLEQLSKRLESLNNKSYQTTYVIHLIVAYSSHIQEIRSLAQSLYEDPYFSLVAKDVASRALELYKLVMEESTPYRTAPENVAIDEKDTVQSGSIWYILNAFMLIPEHIRSLSSQTQLSAEERAKIQANAKKTTITIEQIISNANPYFKLFLKVPAMYRLFKEMQVKLEAFTSVSQEAVLSHLEEIKTDLFARALLEADAWEDRLCLKPGELSGPLKAIFDEFYKGLVEPLGLESQRHIHLVNSMVPIDKRLNAANARKKEAENELSKYEPNYQILLHLKKACTDYMMLPENTLDEALLEGTKSDLEKAYREALPLLEQHEPRFASIDEPEASPRVDEFLQNLYEKEQALNPVPAVLNGEELAALTKLQGAIKRYKNFTTGILPPTYPIMIEYAKTELIHAYKAVAPILTTRYQTYYHLPSYDLEDSAQQEVFFKKIAAGQIPYLCEIEKASTLTEPKRQLGRRSHILARCKIALSYYQGLVNTHSLTRNAAQEKSEYLNNLREEQASLNKKFIDDYIRSAFEKRLELLGKRQIQKEDRVRKEYNEKVCAYLVNKHYHSIAEKAHQASEQGEDINAVVEREMESQVREFDKTHMENYFHLDQIMIEVDKIRTYLIEAQEKISNNFSVFESQITLHDKSKFIGALEGLALNRTKTAASRISEMQSQVKGYRFEAVMCAHAKLEPFTLEWILKLVISFLAALHLYSPPYKKRYEQLKHNIEVKPDVIRLNRRYMIFNQVPRNYDLPTSQLPEIPETEALPPIAAVSA